LCIASRSEVSTLISHLLTGTISAGLGQKPMVQLVFDHCTRNQLLKAKARDENESENDYREFQTFCNGKPSGSGTESDRDGIDTSIQRLRMLTDKAYAIKMSVLWCLIVQAIPVFSRALYFMHLVDCSE
jgi:hypothetical protein